MTRGQFTFSQRGCWLHQGPASVRQCLDACASGAHGRWAGFFRAGEATVYPEDALQTWCLGRLRIAEAPTAVSMAIVEAEPVSEASEASPDDEAMSDEAIYASGRIDYSAIEAGLRLVAALEGA